MQEPTNPEIDTLACRAKGGDRIAFNQLVHLLNPRLYGFLARHVLSEHERTDIAQLVWVRIVYRFGQYDSEKPFMPWFFAIARRIVVDFFRQNSRTPPMETLIESVAVLPDWPADHWYDLESCLAKLSDRRRQILVSRYWERKTLDEIATEMGQSYSAVKAAHHHAIRFLKKCLKSEASDESS